jgi:voltage-gated potassium channel
MTTPERSGAAPPPNPHPRATNVLLGKPLTALAAARIIATVTIGVTVTAGVLMRVTDAKEFPNIGDGLWWAIQTVTTVGYGDHVPTSPGGRLIAALVMLVGIAFLTLITAAITSTFIETARRRVDGTAGNALSTKLDQIVARLDVIDAGLASIRASDRDDPQ